MCPVGQDYIPRAESNACSGEQKSEANYKEKEKLAGPDPLSSLSEIQSKRQH